MIDITLDDKLDIVDNQIRQWKKSQFDAIVARRVLIKLGDSTKQADGLIARAETALMILEAELLELKGESDAPS